MRDELLEYYERELAFLRQLGAEFAEKYPNTMQAKLANLEVARTQLGPDGIDKLTSGDATARKAMRVSSSLGSRVVRRWSARPGTRKTRAARRRDPCTAAHSSIVRESDKSVTAIGV